MELSIALKRFRKELKITQKQAAAAANVSERNYQAGTTELYHKFKCVSTFFWDEFYFF